MKNVLAFGLFVLSIAFGPLFAFGQNCNFDFSQTHNPGQTIVTVTGNGLDQYQWSNNATTQSITVTTAGTYTVTVTDWQGGPCTAVASINVTVDPPGGGSFCQIDFTTNESCGQTTITVIGNGIDLYNWNTGATTQSITVTTAGTYTVTVTDWQGGPCTATASKTVSVNPSLNPTITANGPTTFCTGGSVTLTASPAQTYQWSNGQTTQSITVSQTGTYWVTQTNGNCSGTSNSISVSVGQSPTASISGNLNICQGGTTILTASGGNSYQWSNGANSNVVNVGPGTYTVTVSNGPNCTASKTVTVTASQSVNATINGNNSFCQGSSTILTASGGNSYQWSNGQSGPTITVTTAGTYTVTVTNGNCTGTASKLVTVNPLPVVPTVTASVQGETVTLVSSVANSYLWTGGATTQSYTFVPNQSGIYYLTVTNQFGCTNVSGPIPVVKTVCQIVPTCNLNANTTATPASCFGCSNGSAVVNVTGANGSVTYLWSNGQTSQSISGLSAGAYCVTVKDGNNCTATSCTTVTQPNTPNCNLVVNTFPTAASCFGCANGSVTTSISGANGSVNYLWNTGATGSTLTNVSSGTYTVTATDANNCTAIATAFVSQPGNNPAPVADFTLTRVDCGITYLFDSSPSLNSPTSWYWEFQGGIPATSTEEYPIVVFSTKGDKVIKLTVSNGNGSDTKVQIVNVKGITMNQGVLSGGTVEQGSYVTLQAPPGEHYHWGGIGIDGIEVPTLTSTLGTQNFSVTVTQSNGSSEVYCFVFTVVPNLVGGNEPENSLKVKSFPNPTDGFVTIEGLELLTPIVVFDEVGRIMSQQQYDGEIDLSSYPSGIYFIAGEGVRTQRVVKQ